jgi:hypothetical protein
MSSDRVVLVHCYVTKWLKTAVSLSSIVVEGNEQKLQNGRRLS